MIIPARGEVWLADFGDAGKIRPALVLSIPIDDIDRAIVTVVPHTTSVRGTRFEIDVPARFLKPGSFDAQGMATLALVKFLRQLGKLQSADLARVESAVRLWLGL
jgi:mRNA interferase MazF